MGVLKTFTISGLWGAKDLSLSFHEDVNFLIGPNGSGKTTVINLIAAALSADFPTLDRVEFKKIDIHLTGPDGAMIQVLKKKEPDSPFLGVTYRYKPKRDGPWKVFSLENVEGQMAFRDWSRHTHRRVANPIEVLGIEVNFTWLSIHRAAPSRPREDRTAPKELLVPAAIDAFAAQLPIDPQLKAHYTRLFTAVNPTAAGGPTAPA